MKTGLGLGLLDVTQLLAFAYCKHQLGFTTIRESELGLAAN